MNKSLIRTPLSSSEPGFDVPSQCAWSLSAKTWKCHRNISNCSKVLKEAKIHLKCSSRQTNISRESFFDHFFTTFFDGEKTSTTTKSSKFNCSFSLSCLSSNFTPMYLTQFTILFFEPSFISFVEKHNICLSYY